MPSGNDPSARTTVIQLWNHSPLAPLSAQQKELNGLAQNTFAFSTIGTYSSQITNKHRLITVRGGDYRIAGLAPWQPLSAEEPEFLALVLLDD